MGELANRVRAKYPDAYDDMNDQQLESAVLAKHPEYQDLAGPVAPLNPATPPAPQPMGSQAESIAPQQKGLLPWLNRVEGDVKQGGQSTAVGNFLRMLGVQGTEFGAGKDSGGYLASPITGPIHAAQGIAETPEHPIRGPLKAAGGLLETATLPLAFLSPGVGEAGAEGVAQTGNKLSRLIPSAERASQNFTKVMSQAKDTPLQVSNRLSGVLTRYQELVDAGGSRSQVVSKLLNRITTPDKAPLTYGEARDFYSNISRLSADEYSRLTPAMKSQIGNIRSALNESIQGAAGETGNAARYGDAMNEYRRAAKLKDAGQGAKKYLLNQTKEKLPWLALGYGVKKAID